MKKRRTGTLAASFVVTVSTSTLAGCGKKPVVEPDPDPPGARFANVYRSPQGCYMSEPVSCPKGVSCNPPAPIEVDCPASHRDAGEVDPSPARPQGKEGWLRAKPHLYASQYGCSYNLEYFCAPPGQPYQCARPTPAFMNLKCARADAGVAAAPFRIEAFVLRDASGACRAIPAFECAGGDCISTMPAGEPAPCPP